MHWLQKLGPQSRNLEAINANFLQMLEDGRHIFDAAANALVGGTDPTVIREDLFKTDQRINQTEQSIRREIVIHGTIHGAGTFPALLVLMSLVKDAERIGDYCKNIYELASLRPPLGTTEEVQELIELKDQISKLIVRARAIYQSQDEDAATNLIQETGELGKVLDAKIEQGVMAQDQNRSGLVLAYRYFKRVSSHTGNIVTSIIMPLDKLDYFDEPGG